MKSLRMLEFILLTWVVMILLALNVVMSPLTVPAFLLFLTCKKIRKSGKETIFGKLIRRKKKC